jgi:hypothetical protein
MQAGQGRRVDRKDPKGYYAALQVAPNASAPLIKAAYRHRAMELHPDRNKAPSATAEFQLLTQAYSVLSDSKLRAAYDTQAAVLEPDRPGKAGSAAAPPSHEPVSCSICSKVTAQPRYAVFWEVKSFLLVSQRTPIQGIFCPACAEKKSFRASGITWLLGWWGIPWGPIFSAHAILSNLIGGEKPALINARILTYQAIALGLRGQSNIAIGIAREALKFAKKVPRSEPLRDSLMSTLENICKSAPPNTPTMVNGWSLLNRAFYVHAGVLVAAVVALVIAFNSGDAGRGTPDNLASTPTVAGPVAYRNPATPKPAYVRPTTAPNGTPWPTTAGYISHYKKKNMAGLSRITIDNTQSDSDVFVKLSSVSGGTFTPVRWFFIPAFGRFSAAKLTKGNYRIEYKDLSTGRSYRGDVFEAQEIPMPGRVEYSDDSLTLYKVRDGNTNLAEIDDADFDVGTNDSVDVADQVVRQ